MGLFHRVLFFGSLFVSIPSYAATYSVGFDSIPGAPVGSAIVDPLSYQVGPRQVTIDPNGNMLAVFDSTNPTGPNNSGSDDGDLGSPNEDCAGGGNGVGSAGAPTDAYPNCEFLNALLVIQEENANTNGITQNGDMIPSPGPDDNASGGTFGLRWDTPVYLETLTFLDVENDDSFVNVYLNGVMTGQYTIPNLGDNGLGALTLYEPADAIEIQFDESGGFAAAQFSVPVPGAAALFLVGLGGLWASRRALK